MRIVVMSAQNRYNTRSDSGGKWITSSRGLSRNRPYSVCGSATSDTA